MSVVEEFRQEINDITCIGKWTNDEEVHDFYIVEDFDALRKICSRESERYDADDIFSTLLGLNQYSNSCWGFADEYDVCHMCNQVVSLDEYGYWVNDKEGYLACGDCVRLDTDIRDAYLKHLTNNPQCADVIFKEEDLVNLGYTRCDKDFETGLYEFQDDDPESILENAKAQLDDDEFIFRIDATSPFDIRYNLFSKKV